MPIFLLLIILPLYGFGSQTVAVLNFNADATLSDAQRTAFQQRITTFAAENPEWTLIERNQMDLILQEQGFQQSGVCEKDCQLQMGRLLGADLLVMGSIAKMGKQWSITSSLVDVASGRVIRSAMTDVADEEDLVGNPVHAMVAALMHSEERGELMIPRKTSLWPWVAGGTVFVGAVVAGIIWALPGKTEKRNAQELELSDKH